MYLKEKFASLNAAVHTETDEIALVRDLAAEVADWSHTAEMAAIRDRWVGVTEMRPVDRPPVWCNPVGCWSELLPDGSVRDYTSEPQTSFLRRLWVDFLGLLPIEEQL